MYTLDLEFYNRQGFLLGRGFRYIPGREPHAVIEFVREQVTQDFLGQKPFFIRASVANDPPLLIDMGVSYDS